MPEQDLLPWEQVSVSREEASGGMGLIMAGILNNIEIRAVELGLENNVTISDETDELVTRSLIMVNGIKRNAKSSRLRGLLDRSAGLYNISHMTLCDFAYDQESLVDKIRRFGVALQGDMNTNKLLTETAKRKLQELEEPEVTSLGS